MPPKPENTSRNPTINFLNRIITDVHTYREEQARIHPHLDANGVKFEAVSHASSKRRKRVHKAFTTK